MIITKSEFEALPESLKEKFTEVNGQYDSQEMSKEDHDLDVSGLKNKRDELLASQADLKKQITTLETSLHDATVKGGKGDAKAEEIKTSYEKRLSEMEAQHKAEVDALNGEVNGLTVGAVAKSIANSLFKDKADLMIHHVESRLRPEVVDGKRKISILDKEGQVSSATQDDLVKEFRNDARFSGLISDPPSSTGGPKVPPIAAKTNDGKPLTMQQQAEQLVNSQP